MKQALEREARVKTKAIAVWSVDGYGYGCHTTAMDKGFESKVKPTHASSHATYNTLLRQTLSCWASQTVFQASWRDRDPLNNRFKRVPESSWQRDRQ